MGYRRRQVRAYFIGALLKQGNRKGQYRKWKEAIIFLPETV
jgi:hypothetical protein